MTMIVERSVIKSLIDEWFSSDAEDLVDHIFMGLGDYMKTSATINSLKKIRAEMHETHQTALDLNQLELDAVRGNCTHLVTKRFELGCCGRSICAACGTEVPDVQS